MNKLIIIFLSFSFVYGYQWPSYLKIKLQTDHLNNSSNCCPDITDVDLWHAAQAAMNTWNNILTFDSDKPFEEVNDNRHIQWSVNTTEVQIVYTDDPTFLGTE